MKFKPAHKRGEIVVELSSEEKELQPFASEVAAAIRLKKILAPVDFSVCSNKALAYAVAFSQKFGAELMLLHVVERYPPIPQMDPVDGEAVREARRKLEALRCGIDDVITSQALLRTGDPPSEITEVANELGVDLIILATRRRSGWAHLLLGTAEKVIRHAGCPVLILREHEHEFIEGMVGDAIAWKRQTAA